MAKQDNKFVITDITTSKKIEQTFSDLSDHINNQQITQDKKETLELMVTGFRDRFDNKQSLSFNAAMINAAVNQVNRYL